MRFVERQRYVEFQGVEWTDQAEILGTVPRVTLQNLPAKGAAATTLP